MLLLSSDSKYLFSVNGSRLNVHSISSGEIVYRLSYKSPSLQTTNELSIDSICLNPHNKYQLLSFHQHGIICLWDYEDGLLLKAFETTLKIRKVLTTSSNVLAVAKSVDKNDYSLYKLMLNDLLKPKISIEHELVASNLDINDKKFCIAAESNMKYVAYLKDRKKLVIKLLNNTKKEIVFNESKTMDLTCLAIHPNEDCIATGTYSGKIILWYNYLDCINQLEASINNSSASSSSLKPSKTILHWHSLSVLSLCFTTEGSYLLSGGYECVLVKWMYKTGQKDFKPRLGAPLDELHCARDNTLYATRHSDNTIQIIGSNLDVLQTFSSFLCPDFSDKFKITKSNNSSNSTSSIYPAGLKYFSRLNCMVSNGKPGHLQFYSHNQDKLLFNLDICDENYISPENLDRPLVHTQIECVAFSTSDSSWMATVERRDDHMTTPEIRLKFWRFDQSLNKFVLNTLVRYPHSFEKVNSIKFMPNENRLVSCGNDGCFKTWVLAENKHQAEGANQPSSSWIYDTCNGYRELMPTNIEFTCKSDDSSSTTLDLLAISFDHVVTLWTYGSSGIGFYDELITCDPTDRIREMKFVHNDLLVVHEKYLNFWKYTSATSLLHLNENQESDFNCVWSEKLASSCELATICSSPTELAVGSGHQILLIFKYKNADQASSETKLKFSLFDLNDGKPRVQTIHEYKVASKGPIHFIATPKSIDEETSSSHYSKDQNNLLLSRKANIFFCDNRGIMERVNLNRDSEDDIACLDDMDMELSDQLWNNRVKMVRNLAKSSLSTILDYHKSLRTSKDEQLIESNLKISFEENLKKIESTPAYLLPKVSSFCLETLKSMFLSIDNDISSSASQTIRFDNEKNETNGLLNGHDNQMDVDDDNDDSDNSSSSDSEETSRQQQAKHQLRQVEENLDYLKNKKTNGIINETILKKLKPADFLINFAK